MSISRIPRGRSLVATATTALVLATLVPSAPAFADDDEPLTTTPSIAGVVTDPAGVVAPDLCVAADVFDGTAWAPVDLGAEIRTDATGAYALTGLADGTYSVSAGTCTGPTDTLRTWSPSLDAVPVIVDGTVAEGIAVVDGIAAPADIRLLPAAVSVTDAPTITGEPLVGSELVADPGVWSISGLSFSYRWLRDDAPIADATDQAYTITADELGANITVEVTATRDGWTAGTAASTAVGPVLQAFTPGERPVIDGDAVFGSSLTATVEGWPEDADIAWRWSRNGGPIDDVDDTHEIAADDVDAFFTVAATISKPGYLPVTVVSDPTGAVAAATITPGTTTVTGTAKVGEQLSAATGGWAPAAVSTSIEWLRNGTPVGATGSTYVLSAADLGAAISVRVTGVLAGHTTVSAVSAATAPIGIASLVTSAPVITGTPKVGVPLTVAPGWKPSNVAYAYVWKRNGTAITGATKSSYTPVAADLGAKISVSVTGTLPGYTTVVRTTASTAAVAVGTFSAPTATITGTIAVGRTVTATPGAWKPGAAFTYQWKRNGVAITGATRSTYAIPAGDAKAALSVTITGKATAYTTLTKTSAATTVAYGTLTAPTPTVSGTRAVDRTLTAVAGTWGPSTVALSYQWKRNGVAITGATKTTYLLTASDLGKTITVTVTGRRTAYASAAKTSVAGAAIAPGTLHGPTPTISGTRTVGKTLTAVPGTWKPVASLSYQWKRAGVSITGATKSTYVLTASDLGKSITVTVTGRKTAYTTLAKTSGGTAHIAAGAITFSAKLTGTQRAGSTLTASAGSVSPGGTTVKYQWYRNGAVISGKTSSTYTLGNVDAGKVVSVTITASKAGYTTKSATLKTAAVANRPASFSGDYWFRVGIDVQPGTYYTSTSSTTNCRWWRTTSTSGTEDSVLGFDPGGSGRRMITILATDRYVAAIGCGSWIRYDGTGNPSSTMAGNGIAAVGTMLKPGRYVSYGNSECWAADWSAPAGDEAHYIGGGTYDGDLYWIVEPGTFFETYNCNTFTRYAD
ncbi:hypothetical protein [Agromyces sp. NPDC058110]|uniref:hypothetical protein n=1 Tax=Agromyces sp. NPDC058110 TaxID=3346345 RepID=UPI0036D846A6